MFSISPKGHTTSLYLQLTKTKKIRFQISNLIIMANISMAKIKNLPNDFLSLNGRSSIIHLLQPLGQPGQVPCLLVQLASHLLGSLISLYKSGIASIQIKV